VKLCTEHQLRWGISRPWYFHFAYEILSGRAAFSYPQEIARLRLPLFPSIPDHVATVSMRHWSTRCERGAVRRSLTGQPIRKVSCDRQFPFVDGNFPGVGPTQVLEHKKIIDLKSRLLTLITPFRHQKRNIVRNTSLAEELHIVASVLPWQTTGVGVN